MHIVAVRFTPEQKAELKILVDDHTARFRELGRPMVVTESDAVRWLVADAVAAIKRRDAQAAHPVALAPTPPAVAPPPPPPPPPVAARVEQATPPAPRAPSARKPVVSKAVSTTDYTGVELPEHWPEEHREAHRKCAEFIIAHPGVTQKSIAHALGFKGDSAANFNAFLRGKKALPQSMWRTVDSVLASLES